MAGIRAAFKVFFLNFVLQRLTETCVSFPATAYALHVSAHALSVTRQLTTKMKKKNFGLCFKLKFNTGTSMCFTNNGGLENKNLRTDNFQPHCNRERFSPTLLALAIAAHATLNQSNGKSQTNRQKTSNLTKLITY